MMQVTYINSTQIEQGLLMITYLYMFVHLLSFR